MRYQGLQGVFKDEDLPMTPENVIAGLVAAVRADDHEEDRSGRDVFKQARSRRRRLGLLSFGAGPLAGVATQVVDLYCETALLCDLVDLHSLNLTNHDIAAHMLVMWGIVDGIDEATSIMSSEGEQSLAEVIGRRVHEQGVHHLPDEPTKSAVLQVLWRARSLPGEVGRTGAGATGRIGGVVFTGHRTKQLIGQAERQLGV
jgi:hypothetical protein